MKEQIKKTSILLGAIFLIVAGLLWFSGGFDFGKQTAAIDGNFSGVLTVKESQYDFGDVSMAKGDVSTEFVLENQSKDNVKIGDVSTSCMCTEAELKMGDKTYGPFGMPGHLSAGKANAIVNTGEKVIVKVIFDPAAHGPSGIGEVVRQIFINTGNAESLILTLKANVTP